MSVVTRVHTQVYLRCDAKGDDCAGWWAGEESVADTRWYAERHGWKTDGKGKYADVCPRCAADELGKRND